MIGLLGIISAVVAPRLFSMDEIQERFFADEVRSALAHGQKRAVSTGCEVQMTIDGTGYALRQRLNCTGAFTQDVPHPAGTAASYSGTPPAGVPLTSTVNPIVFDALGRARDGGGNIVDVSVGVGPIVITTVGETGFVFGPGA